MAIKTNELPGTRAVLRHCPMSGFKAREVLDLIRGVEYQHALDILHHCDRGAASVIEKLLRSAGANAEHNDVLDLEDLYVASCFADEGTTLKRWRPRARGRATRIRKRTCHVTIILARLPEDRLARRRARATADAAERRARRVAGTRRRRRVEESVAKQPEIASIGTNKELAPKEALGADLEAAEEAIPTDESSAGKLRTEDGKDALDGEDGLGAPSTDTDEGNEEHAPDADSATDKDES
jgi:large subunit ribosomal protein L22